MKKILSVLAPAVFALVAFTSIASDALAARDTIRFGGTVGFAYKPDTMTVAVGDTIVWIGDFGFHPLIKDKFPLGSGLFAPPAGGVPNYSYVVLVPGDYTYECAVHGPKAGMGGTMAGFFTTLTNSAPPGTPQVGTVLYPIVPNPASKTVMIDFTLAKTSNARITISSIDGKQVAQPLNETMQSGAQMIDFDVSKLATGTYIVTLEAGGVTASKQMVVTK